MQVSSRHKLKRKKKKKKEKKGNKNQIIPWALEIVFMPPKFCQIVAKLLILYGISWLQVTPLSSFEV